MGIIINEIFYSIQGESIYSGFPCIFIRFTGCNLRCSYCDTKYAYYEGKEEEIDNILKKIKIYPCNLIEITGGEPLLQNEVTFLINSLIKNCYQVLIETNGSLSIKNLPKEGLVKILDLKCPGSGMSHKMDFGNIELLTKDDQIKFAIKDKRDFLWAVDVIKRFNLEKMGQILFSPVFGVIEPKDLAEWIKNSGLKARLQLQLQKVIWGEKKGV